jgi:hypothetical protein
MKGQNDVETYWPQEQGKRFDTAVGYYELRTLDEAEAELSKIDPSIAAQSVPILTLQLAIAYCRSDWNKMKDVARKLFLLDPSDPKWSFADGYATAKMS